MTQAHIFFIFATIAVTQTAWAEGEEAVNTYPQLRKLSAYRNASVLAQQMMEDAGISSENQLQQKVLPRGGFLGGLATKRFNANSVGELFEKREAAAFKTAREAVGYSKQSATFKEVFDRLLRGAKGRKFDSDYSQLENWEIEKSSLITARVIAELASEGAVGRGVAGGGNTVVDFNNPNPAATTLVPSTPIGVPAVPFNPSNAGNVVIFPGSGGQTVRR